MECQGYDTKVPHDISEVNLSRYLLEVHRERVRRWNAPLRHVDVAGILID